MEVRDLKYFVFLDWNQLAGQFGREEVLVVKAIRQVASLSSHEKVLPINLEDTADKEFHNILS